MASDVEVEFIREEITTGFVMLGLLILSAK